jgi:hypothetical protein
MGVHNVCEYWGIEVRYREVHTCVVYPYCTCYNNYYVNVAIGIIVATMCVRVLKLGVACHKTMVGIALNDNFKQLVML